MVTTFRRTTDRQTEEKTHLVYINHQELDISGAIGIMETNKASFGVELEFLVCVASADQELNVPNMFENSTGAPILLPPGVPNRGFNAVEIARQRAERTMANAVAERRGTRVIQSMEEALSDPDSIHLQNFSEWSFESDPSVYLTADLRDEQYINEYYWVSVEIASPAFWDTPESWAEIREVVDAFKAEYWIITPHTAGMHYHYGHGKDYIPFTKIRRMAALLVAVDPLIVQLHPTHRRANEYCLSNRLYSRIAHGSPAAVNARAIGAEYVEGEPEFPGSRPQPNPVARPFRRRTPNLLVPFSAGSSTDMHLMSFSFSSLLGRATPMTTSTRPTPGRSKFHSL